jgi:hypothetical protein
MPKIGTDREQLQVLATRLDRRGPFGQILLLDRACGYLDTVRAHRASATGAHRAIVPASGQQKFEPRFSKTIAPRSPRVALGRLSAA